MKIIITIPDADVAGVVEYCRIEEIDLQDRMQIELDNFVGNVRWWLREQRKQAKADPCRP